MKPNRPVWMVIQDVLEYFDADEPDKIMEMPWVLLKELEDHARYDQVNTVYQRFMNVLSSVCSHYQTLLMRANLDDDSFRLANNNSMELTQAAIALSEVLALK
jgi:hypothetical protein